MFKFIHAADFHLDSPFAALPPRRAAERRRESRELPLRLAEYAVSHGIDLMLLAGDLFDGGVYRETAEALRDGLGRAGIPAFIAPGNHDWYGADSPYATLKWPENVHIFTQSAMESVELPQCTVSGAAFTAPEQADGLLSGFSAPEDGKIRMAVLHGELGSGLSPYNPISEQDVASSGLHYLALGHIHKRTEPLRCGKTVAAWPGCPEGRGFDELGEKGFYEGTVSDDGAVALRFIPFARHRYEILSVDVTGRDPAAAVERALPPDTAGDLYRIVLTGETEKQGIFPETLQSALNGRFYSVEIRDETHVSEDIWAAAGEDSLRGLFLRELRKKRGEAATEAERAAVDRAVRFGLAALEHRDLG